MPEFAEIYEFLQTTLRSVGGEITSPWFYFQIGPDPGRRGARAPAGRLASRQGRPHVLRHGLACGISPCGSRAGPQCGVRVLRVPDGNCARRHGRVNLAEPQLPAGRCRQSRRRVAADPPCDQPDPQRDRGEAGLDHRVVRRGRSASWACSSKPRPGSIPSPLPSAVTGFRCCSQSRSPRCSPSRSGLRTSPAISSMRGSPI